MRAGKLFDGEPNWRKSCIRFGTAAGQPGPETGLSGAPEDAAFAGFGRREETDMRAFRGALSCPQQNLEDST